jgi:hypothetical protein
MTQHICEEETQCYCDLSADMPDEECPVHGSGVYPHKCKICGRFMKREPKYGDYFEDCDYGYDESDYGAK